MTTRAFAAKRIVTCDPAHRGTLGVIENGVVVVQDGRIAFVGAETAQEM